jgi:alpha-1,4-digalacturonate transport system permease protein
MVVHHPQESPMSLYDKAKTSLDNLSPTQKLYNALMNALDWVFNPLQQRVGLQRMAYIFILPNLLIFGVFILLPMLLNFYYAFTGGTELLPQNRPFVGTANFEALLDCEDFSRPTTCREDIFWRAVGNTIQYVVFQVTGIVLLSLITALALNRRIRFRGFFRSVFFYPVLLSPVVVALIWRWILQRDGVLNALLVAIGQEPVDFFLNADWARFWVIFVSIWSQMGFFTLILLAGLQSIPLEYGEAAQIDGASDWNVFRHITLPLLMPTLLVVFVLSLVRAVQVFDQSFALIGGGPGTATTYIVQYIYNTGFTSPTRQAGLAAAASVLLAIVLVILTVAQLRLRQRAEDGV